MDMQQFAISQAQYMSRFFNEEREYFMGHYEYSGKEYWAKKAVDMAERSSEWAKRARLAMGLPH